MEPNNQYQTKVTIFKTYQVVWYIAGLINTLLLIRFVFKMLGANRVGIVNMLYEVTDPLALPFYGIFGRTSVSDKVFEWTTLVAILFFFLLAYAIVKLLGILKPASPDEVNKTI